MVSLIVLFAVLGAGYAYYTAERNGVSLKFVLRAYAESVREFFKREDK